MQAIPAFKRLVRFVPRSDTRKIFIGEPLDEEIDVGLELHSNQAVRVRVFSGSSVIAPGEATSLIEEVERLLSPVSSSECGTIRCIGLNYKQHAAEVKMDLPSIPTLFLKPSTALGDPFPSPTMLHKVTQQSDTGDYESELAVIIGRNVKNVSVDKAMDYVLGYTAANDVSSRESQLSQSQWCFSKGFDGSCPIGPVLVSKELIPDPANLRIRGLKNGEVMQDCECSDLIFSIPEIVSFLSQGTTLPAGTVIITGTPAGVGMGKSPPVRIRSGDEFAVEILPHIGTLISKFENEI